MAYESGRLTGKNQSRVQRWALGYHKYATRLIHVDEYDEIRKVLHFILRGTDAKLYELAFPRVEVNDPDVVPGHSYGVDDLEGMEKLLRKLDRMQTKSQIELASNEWTDWR